MTKHYAQSGAKKTATAPAGGVTSGLGYVIGAQFMVAEDTQAAAAEFVGLTEGVHDLPADAADAFTDGQQVWWDNTTKTCLNVSTSGAFLIGTAWEAISAAAGQRLQVRLDGVSVTAVP